MQPWRGVFAVLAMLFCSISPCRSGEPPAPVKQKDAKQHKHRSRSLMLVPTVKWLPEPIEVPNYTAKIESEMKPYTDVIPGSNVTFDMVPIPGGKFMMGSPENEAGRWLKDEKNNEIKDKHGNRVSDEGPQHEVVIEPFWMGKHEVTWNEFELWAFWIDLRRRQQQHREQGTQPSARELTYDAVGRPSEIAYGDMSFGMGRDGYPAICMTHLSAKVYCKWLSAKTGRYYRLPTEAEWEYACRAGTTTAYSFGDDPKDLDAHAWYFDNCDSEGKDGYHRVGRMKPNPWGLYDMHGNVSEWVLDQYNPRFYQRYAGETVTGPLLVPRKLYPRVARGGCWWDDPDRLRSAARTASNRSWHNDPQIPPNRWFHWEEYCPGFRVVRPLNLPTVRECRKYDVSRRDARWDNR